MNNNDTSIINRMIESLPDTLDSYYLIKELRNDLTTNNNSVLDSIKSVLDIISEVDRFVAVAAAILRDLRDQGDCQETDDERISMLDNLKTLKIPKIELARIEYLSSISRIYRLLKEEIIIDFIYKGIDTKKLILDRINCHPDLMQIILNDLILEGTLIRVGKQYKLKKHNVE